MPFRPPLGSAIFEKLTRARARLYRGRQTAVQSDGERFVHIANLAGPLPARLQLSQAASSFGACPLRPSALNLRQLCWEENVATKNVPKEV